ncbi:nicotinate-nucleotide--dimethylbenzimidazole phosphoribosyltransferase [Paraflavisolibacter sp. H34]|uniref:nicotinate-nucleotide--dimethylbenzimidazole phosphoribosyltransferase n=1 Tax=Huijunlia imazamoxiresistens TaxID=3127457 RepID=UPI003019652E
MRNIAPQIQSLIDQKTKPLGALGMLERLALQIGTVLNTTTPSLQQPHIVVFAADHGIAREGVSAYPPEVTAQMVLNFSVGGAAINVFCRQHGLGLTIVDAGVAYDFPPDLPIRPQKAGRGTRSFLKGPAMEIADVHFCLEKGREVVRERHAAGCNTIGFGEMGIGNTSSAAMLMSLLCALPLEACIGRGTGLSEEQFARKQDLLHQAMSHYSGATNDIYGLLAQFGGYEIVQMAGAVLEAADRGMLILVDGFIATVAFLCAFKIAPPVRRNALFCHQSEEQGHQRLLRFLEAEPVLQLGMRLGEGTGCALAFPVLQSAVAFLNEMASFESAGVSNKS